MLPLFGFLKFLLQPAAELAPHASRVSRAPGPLDSASVKSAKKNGIGSCSAVDFFYRHLPGIDRL